jgi:hypothetical protein
MSGIFELRGYVGDLRLANMRRQGDRMRSADVRLWRETDQSTRSDDVRSSGVMRAHDRRASTAAPAVT